MLHGTRLSIDDVFSEVKNQHPSGAHHIKGLCPFHNDSNPSFSIQREKLLWICHAGCGSGNVIQYVSKIKDIENKDAAEYLCNQAGCEYLRPKKSKASLDILLNLVAKEDLFLSPNKIAYVGLVSDGKNESIKIESDDFKKWLKTKFYKKTGQAPESQALSDAVDVLLIKAKDEGKEAELNLRVARAGDSLYLDLCDDKGQVVEITKNGWSLINQSPVCFVRKPGMLALDEPLRNGSLETDLRPFLNLKNDRDWKLCLGWLISTINASGPFPILGIQGEQGSGKSFMAKVLRHVIDPNTSPVSPDYSQNRF